MRHLYQLALFCMALCCATLLPGCKKDAYRKDINNLKMHQTQSIGSHNSYRKAPDTSIYNFLVDGQQSGLMPADLDPQELDYDHIPLGEQLSTYYMRSLELDIYHDPQGGRFYNRMCNAFVGLPVESGEAKLQEPGFKIIHIPDVDYNTHYFKLVDALTVLRDWSAANKNHLPLVVMLELKTGTPGDVLAPLGFVTALPITKAALDSLEGEIRSVFGNDLKGVFTPDKLRGKKHATVAQAALAGDWPKLKAVRGEIVFVLMANDDHKAAYLDGHPNLQGRACFFFDEPGSPQAAFVKRDNPINNLSEIQSLVQQGYIVRTRADAGTIEARNGDYTMLNAALESGAQLISTDYYRPDPRGNQAGSGWSDYKASLPAGAKVARPNPLNAGDALGDDWQQWADFE